MTLKMKNRKDFFKTGLIRWWKKKNSKKKKKKKKLKKMNFESLKNHGKKSHEFYV